MDKKLLELEDELVDRLNSLPAIEKIKEIEKKMMEDEECRKLIDIFQCTQEDYNFYLKSFGEKHEFTISSQKRLYEAKLNMDNNYLVKEYNKYLSEINTPLRYIEYNLISLFQRKKGHSC